MDFEEFERLEAEKKVRLQQPDINHVSRTAHAGSSGSSALEQMEAWEDWEDYMQFGFAARAAERDVRRDHFGFHLPHRRPNDL